MYLELSEEQKMFREAIRSFAEKEIAPLVEEAEEKEKFPVELFPKLGRLGYLCITYPVEYGGAGMGKVSEGIWIEEIARISGGITAALMVSSGVATSIICDHGSEELKQKYLVPTAKGEKIAAFTLTEPNAGSDAAALETTAVGQGDGYILNGTKIFISNAPIADFLTVAAYTDKSKGARGGVSIFVVDKGTPGVTITHMSKMGNRSTETGEVSLGNCHVPQENLVGEEGKGFPYLMETLAGGRISHSFRSLGVAQAAYEASLGYAKERVQFKQPIGKFQAISFKLARLAMEIEAARWLCCRAAWLYDQGTKPIREASMAKLFASEVVNHVTSEAMQIHGGYGYMMDSPVQRYFRDARLYTITEGTTEIQQLVISRDLGL